MNKSTFIALMIFHPGVTLPGGHGSRYKKNLLTTNLQLE